VELLPVDDLGRVHADTVEQAIASDPDSVALVSVMWANNEVGTLQPVGDIAARTRRYGVPLHVDAVQTIGQLPVDFGASGADALTISGHKCGGPPGVAALLLRPEVAVTPLLHGGGQERALRSGTLDAPAIAGLAVGVELAVAERAQRAALLQRLRDDLVVRVQQAVPEARLNGDPSGRGRLPGNANVSFPGCEADALLMLLDAAGVQCSTGSACSAGVSEPSHVLLAMGLTERDATSSLRFSLGWTSMPADVDALLAALPGAVHRAQAAGRLSVRGA
jgi:cysteine desulfurase